MSEGIPLYKPYVVTYIYLSLHISCSFGGSMMKHPVKVQQLFERILKVCQREFAAVSIIENATAIGIRVEREWQIDMLAHTSGFMAASSLRVFVPPQRVRDAVDLINRVNLLSLAGMLEFNLDDSQVRLRHCVYAQPSVINSGLITATVH